MNYDETDYESIPDEKSVKSKYEKDDVLFTDTEEELELEEDANDVEKIKISGKSKKIHKTMSIQYHSSEESDYESISDEDDLPDLMNEEKKSLDFVVFEDDLLKMKEILEKIIQKKKKNGIDTNGEIGNDLSDFALDEDDFPELEQALKNKPFLKIEGTSKKIQELPIQYYSNEESDVESDEENEENKTNLDINITTKGITFDQYKTLNYNTQLEISFCPFCCKYYKTDFIIIDTGGLQTACKHCLFALNYEEKNRLEFDTKCAKNGFGIAEYILECQEEHDSELCMCESCFLCDYKNKKQINNILNYEMLGYENKNINDTNIVDKYIELDDWIDVKLYDDIFNTNKFRIPIELTI